jgi:molecular chaperone HscB
VREGEDYFTVLGAPRKFAQDRARLERRFYELSRALHPDRFSALGDDARKNSVERMSLLNRAWNTLKIPDSLRDYLIRLEGVQVPKAQTVQPPLELVEPWFEIQDLATEDPPAALERLVPFERELAAHFAREDARIAELEAGWDRAPSADGLARIAQRIQARSYLRSMQWEVERIRVRFGKR